MNEHDIESFLLDIDKVISGKLDISSASDYKDREYQELLMVAQMLTKADFSAESPEREKRIWSNLQQDGQLEDDELDMVAGGLNLNAMLDEHEKKK